VPIVASRTGLPPPRTDDIGDRPEAAVGAALRPRLPGAAGCRPMIRTNRTTPSGDPQRV